MMDKGNEVDVELTAHIVSAYVAKNAVQMSDLANLISSVHQALVNLGSDTGPVENVPLVPAVPVKKSVTRDYIICLEDGKKFKSLKRHLSTHYNLTPEQYRAKWQLPPDYPMVAPAYAEARSKLARSLGLGRKPGTLVRPRSEGDGARRTSRAKQQAEEAVAGEPSARRGRGRAKKAAS